MKCLKFGAVILTLCLVSASSSTFSEEVKETADAQKSANNTESVDERKHDGSENEVTSNQQQAVFKRAQLKESIKANANVDLPQDI